MELSEIPSQILRLVEDDTYLTTCDWGMCNGETRAFALSDSGPIEEWLSVCDSCARGQFPSENDEPYPIDRVIWLADIEKAWR